MPLDAGSQALSDYIFYSKYSNFLDGKKESYSEAVDRVMGMHKQKYPHLAPLIFEKLTTALKNKEICGSQRNMQFGGIGVLRKNARSYNCAGSYCDRPRFFSEALWLLLCGCGTGFSVQKHHVAQLPQLKERAAIMTKSRHVVADSIEGWADALNELMKSYFEGDMDVVFDYSCVRPKGAPLSTSSGLAPGPEPLRIALEAIRVILDRAAGRHLRPIECYDIVMHASCAVLSGGVRRSATIALFSPDDEEMLTAKSGNWTESNPQRARSNNSAVLVRSETASEEFERFVEIARYSGGEPGFVWLDSPEYVVNPCSEVCFYPRLPDGRSGWQMCNLSTVNGALITKSARFLEACAHASMLGTLQAGYTDFEYLGEVSEQITRNEALIGVSITGMQDCPDILLDPKWLRRGAEYVVKANKHLAEQIGINPAARCTVIKPEGTTSGLLGTGSGKHRRHAKRYLRRVRAGKNEAPAIAFQMTNPDLVEEAEGGLILKFPIESPEGARLRRDESGLQQLQDVVLIQQNWIEPGTTRNPLKNSVSNTVTVKEDEWQDAARFIFTHRDAFTGVSLLPASGDLDYPKAPFVSIDEPDRQNQKDEWAAAQRALTAVDYTGIVAILDTSDSACGGGQCELP